MFLDEKIEQALPQGGAAVWKVIQDELRVFNNPNDCVNVLKRIANTWKLVLKKHPEITPNWLHDMVVKIITENGATDNIIKAYSNIFKIN